MQFEPTFLAAEPFPIPLHAFFSLIALVLGAVQLALRKGTGLHRALGYVWVTSMALVAFSGLFIHQIRLIGPFSPIHLLSVTVLMMLAVSIRAARRGDIERHRKSMTYMYVLGLVLTGGFTLLPGRAMNAVFFGG
ncbi:MAG: DUF2306 domain-containing protein [Rhodobacteraceae bacterium]|nr:DUF2306 domain-containing protein [Paracoccaceae bacterium]